MCIRDSYYIAKLDEEFGIPYILAEDFNPEKFYKEWSLNNNKYNAALYHAARAGQIDIVQLMINKGASDFNWAIEGASLGGHLDMVKIFIDKGAQIFSATLGNAVLGGNLNIVKLLMDKIDIKTSIGQYFLQRNIKVAKEKGYTEIADFLKNYLVKN